MFFAFLKLIGLTLLGELLRPAPEIENAKPAGFGDVNFPTAEVGRAIPVIFGKVRQRGANLLWYGDYRPFPIITQQKVKGLFKSKTYNQVVGYRYFIGMHLGLASAGVDTVHRIWAEERLAWSGTLALPGYATVYSPWLFGGYQNGGGLLGTMSFWPGGSSQASVPYLGTFQPNLPAYRGITSAIWHGGDMGEAPHIRPLSFELSRYPNNLGLGAVGVDLNPVEILWETMTDPTWGMGASAALLDQAGFQAAGATLASEGLGISTTWDSRRSIGDFCSEILRHIDGIIYPSLREAKLKLSLARDDYVVGSLPVLDTSNVRAVKDFSRTAWQETVNELRVLFTSRASNYINDTASAFDLANFDLQGNRVSRQVQYPGINDPTRANELAWRDLRALSTPLAKCTVVADRVGYQLEPGDVFVLNWAPHDLEQRVMRITRVRPGAPGTSAIEMDVVEDVFSLSSSSFGDPPATAWTEPVADAEAVADQELGEIPYLLLARDDGSVAPGTVDPDLAHAHIVAARPNSSTLLASIQTKVSGGAYVDRGTLTQFAPIATLVNDYPEDTDAVDDSGTLVVEDLEEFSILESVSGELVEEQLRNWAMIGNEIVAWETITDNGDGTYTLTGVWRGLIDTVPADHSAGATMFFASEGSAGTPDTYAQSEVVSARLITSTIRTELAEGSALVSSHTITRRSLRPYPPGKVRINSEDFPEVIEGALVVTWAHRDRTDPDQINFIDQDTGNIGPEAGVTYTLRIYGEGDALLRTETGLSGTSYTYSDEVADAGRLQGELKIQLESVRAGYASHQYQERSVRRAGYGLQYGRYYGGAPP